MRSDDLAAMRREVIARLNARDEQLATALVESLRAEIAVYGTGEEQLLSRQDVLQAGRRHVRIALAGLDNDGRLVPGDRGRLEQLARERAGQGVPLHAFVQAVQVSARELWRALLDVAPEVAEAGEGRAELLADVSRSSLQLTCEIAAVASAAYVETGRHRLVDRERTRQELLEQVLSGSAGPSGPLRRRAAAVGYRLGDAHVVAVVSPSDPWTPTHRAHTQIRDALARSLVPGIEPLLGTHGDAKVAVYPTAPDLAEHRLPRALDRSLVSCGLGELEYHAAIGRVETGVAGIASSYRQAAATIELARDRGLHGQTLSYVRSLPWLLLHTHPDMAHDLRRATVEVLREHDREHRTDLIATCAVLLEVLGNQAEAAKRLHVHRHTLASRLRRIEALTGRSFDDRDDVLLLDLGMRADDLHGRSDGPESR